MWEGVRVKERYDRNACTVLALVGLLSLWIRRAVDFVNACHLDP